MNAIHNRCEEPDGEARAFGKCGVSSAVRPNVSQNELYPAASQEETGEDLPSPRQHPSQHSGGSSKPVLVDDLVLDAKRLGKPAEELRVADDHRDDGEGDGGEEVASRRCLPHPGDPTAAEVYEHQASGHVQYRSWCSSCVKARGMMEQHRKRQHDPQISVFSFD